MPHLRVRAGLAAAALVLGACDVVGPYGGVDQDRLYVDYELHYDGDADVTAARATFRLDGPTGTPLALAGDSHVQADGRTLSRRTDPLTAVTYYERTFPGVASGVTFTFVDAEGIWYRNEARLRAIRAPTSPGPIDNDFSREIHWIGEPLGFDEEVGAVLYRAVGGGALAVFTQREPGATGIVLDRAQLRNVPPGEAALVLERRTAWPPDEPTGAGGRVAARWTAPSVRVEVRE